MLKRIARRSVNTGTKVSNPCSNQDIIKKIKKIAYELYEKRGRIEGHAMDDWFKAEKLVKSGKC